MFLNYVLPFKLAAELRESFRLTLISRSKFSILLVIPRWIIRVRSLYIQYILTDLQDLFLHYNELSGWLNKEKLNIGHSHEPRIVAPSPLGRSRNT